jgi:hypothetical protein
MVSLEPWVITTVRDLRPDALGSAAMPWEERKKMEDCERGSKKTDRTMGKGIIEMIIIIMIRERTTHT